MILESILAGGLIFGSNALDVQSSINARNSGAVELNQLYQNRNVFYGVKAGVSAAEQFGFEKIKKKNKILAWAFVVSITSVNIIIYKHNEGVRKNLR